MATDHHKYYKQVNKVWRGMKQRCLNPNAPFYDDYGGRGIKVCQQWLKYAAFEKDMIASYSPGLTIERIDNNRGYEPDNCRWATRKEQARNTRNTERAMRITYKGQTKTVREWAEAYNINRLTLYTRLVRWNWPIERALR